MGEHGSHQPGTVNSCSTCKELAYEPSWYAAMLAFDEARNLERVVKVSEVATVAP
jgi:hypothetical protein